MAGAVGHSPTCPVYMYIWGDFYSNILIQPYPAGQHHYIHIFCYIEHTSACIAGNITLFLIGRGIKAHSLWWEEGGAQRHGRAACIPISVAPSSQPPRYMYIYTYIYIYMYMYVYVYV